MINTVTGSIRPEQLGWALTHEHVSLHEPGAELDSNLIFRSPSAEEIWDKCVRKLNAARESGIDTIVDMTTVELGRDVDLLRRLSEATGVQIICCTGLWSPINGTIPYHFQELVGMASQHPYELLENRLTDLYIAEIERGIGKTEVKAGVIKVATGGREMTPLEEAIARAACRAQRATGLPILTHTAYGSGGERQIEIFLEEGVPPHKICIGHSDVSANLKYHIRMLRRGAFIGFDKLGLRGFLPNELTAECFASLCRLGYSSQLTLSHDTSCHSMGYPRKYTRATPGFKIREDEEPDAQIGSSDYTHLWEKYFPLLRRAGIDDKLLNSVMVDNPRRLFS